MIARAVSSDSGISSTLTLTDVARQRATSSPQAPLLFFDSSKAGAHHARWSMLLVEPEDVFEHHAGDQEDSLLVWARAQPERLLRDPDASHVPFQGGLAGLLSFEYAWVLDDIRAPHAPTGTMPLAWVGAFLRAYMLDHHTQQWWIVAEDEHQWRRLHQALLDVECCVESTPYGVDVSLEGVASGASASTYEAKVDEARQAILYGEFFEVNYAERFTAPWPHSPWTLYDSMARRSSGAYFTYAQHDGWAVASASPEQFMSIDQRHVITRPIKGSSARRDDPVEDAAQAQALLRSVKDRAENIMIVDLMRNDLTRICEAGSVRASSICALESFAGIHHLVSTVEGTLERGLSELHALLACFPAGSITGAPKLRAIEAIARLEHSSRGAYTGSAFYVSSHGRMDSNVLIRSAQVERGRLRYGAGGAVVYDSDPAAEYQEALLKLGPLGATMEGL